ncbi:MAG: ABC transporter ATP-binding protein, partial [Xanthobacteraceae bacterium]
GLVPSPPGRIEGSIRLKGRELVGLAEPAMRSIRGNAISMIFQEPMTSLDPVMRVGRQIAEPLILHHGLSRRAAEARAVELLQHVRIPEADRRAREYPHQLSGGMRQRVMIAMALACRPAVLLADEPTTALDVTIQAQILRLLIELQRDLGIAMLLITHDLGVVARVAHRVAVMYAGEIIEAGSAAGVLAAPRHPYTRGLVASVPVPGKIAPGSRLGSVPGVVPSLIGEVRGCAFRERCAHARDICAQPVAARVEAEHEWRCVLAPAAA